MHRHSLLGKGQETIRLEMHMTDTVESRLAALGLTLPSAPAPAANYVPFALAHNVLYIAGQLPRGPSGIVYTGKAGADLGIEDAKLAAQLCALNILAQVKAALGGFERVVQCMRLTGFVNSGADFADHAQIMNGASDLMVTALGDKGRHTRVAVGAANLPGNATVEIDATFAIG
jgi:enamine deaminase RidA (YjgF/YER057c/UK114 family)